MDARFLRSNRGLVAVNLALLVVLAVVSVAPEAGAVGPGQPGRGRGEYTMISGRMQGSTASAVYILDSVNQELIAVRWNDSRRIVEGIDYRDLAADTAGNTGQAR